MAAELAKDDRKVVAIIGDGAMTAGMAWEALFNAGARKTNLLVVLNDNDMSISENVGALSNYFAKVLSGRMYSTLRSGGKKILKQMPTMWELARRSEEMMKGMVLPGTLFEEFGFNFIGPIDGHDIKALVTNLRNMRHLEGPQLLHVVTRKGKGYDPAEKDPIKWHGPGPFDPVSGTIFKEKATGPTYSQVFGQWLCDMAAADPKHRRHHARPCAKARAWSNTRRNFRSVTSTSPSPNNMPSRSRPASPARAGSRWSLSTPRSCSAPTTS